MRPILLLLLSAIQLLAAGGFRADRLSLNGTWKFDLRRDNQLTGAGPVSFGPVSASSQAVLIEPWDLPGENTAGRWRISTPWPVSATTVDSERQFWRPHPQQQGVTWWQAILERPRRLRNLHIKWHKPGSVEVKAEVSADGSAWTAWSQVQAQPGDKSSYLSGDSQPVRYLRLTFAPAQFEGVDKIDVETDAGPWRPVIQRQWYEQLRSFQPSGFEQPSFADATWKDITVPGYWEVQKFSDPTWWQPDETVGYYRRTFTAPAAWRGRTIRLRFEGVNNSAQVWVNGKEVGYHESGFTHFEYDVTPHLKLGAQNTIAVRVTKWTLTHDYDTDDVWFLGGIWRNVYLYSLPGTRIDDYLLNTTFDSDYRNAVLRAGVTLRAGEENRQHAYRVEGELIDASGQQVPLTGFSSEGHVAGAAPLQLTLSAPVTAPRQWTAETPYLYTVLLRLIIDGQKVQEFQQHLGFRQVEVKGHSLLVNGRPIRMRGVVTTRANPNDSGEHWEKVFAREIKLLKEANINTIRSHTTPLEEEFLDLCDRHGIYVIPDVPNVWLSEYDFRYLTDGVVLRTREIYEQHKNRTSVVMWHIGNENGVSSAYYGMGQAALWLEQHDSSRPVTICRNLANLSEYGAAVHDFHYNPMQIEHFVKETSAPVLFGEFHALPEEIARLQDRGFVETWGRSLQLEWAEFEKRPWLLGGLICCWDDGSVNGDPGPRQWGVVDSKRHAKPVHPHIRKVFAPVALALEGASLRINNKYDFTDLEGYQFRWKALAGAVQTAAGQANWRVAPRTSTLVDLPPGVRDGTADRLMMEVIDADGYSIHSELLRLKPPPQRNLQQALSSVLAGRKPLPITVRVEENGAVALIGPGNKSVARLEGVVFSQGRGRAPMESLGDVRYGAPRTERAATVLPFSVPSKSLTGVMRIEPSTGEVRVSYELTATDASLALREIGVSLRPDDAAEISWHRETLWSTMPEGWADGATERVPAEDFVRSHSRRNVAWAMWHGAQFTLLVAPTTGAAQLRAGAAGTYHWDSFLSAGDFLGKFDRNTVQHTLEKGATFRGGFVLKLLPTASSTRLTALYGE
jgi:hypothetical protein